jgi:hypothetical protein
MSGLVPNHTLMFTENVICMIPIHKVLKWVANCICQNEIYRFGYLGSPRLNRIYIV